MKVQSEGGLRKRFSQALKEARLGVREAQYEVGLMYANGLGVERNLQDAVYWIQKAAEKGLGSAQYLLGTRYASGIGVGADPFMAQFWLQKAAAQEHPKAFLRLGVLLQNRSSAISRSYFERALALGAIDASFYLGRFAELEGDWETAANLYEKASQAGSSRASYALGELHRVGRIGSVGDRQAIEHFRKAAKGSYPPALVALHELDKAGHGRKTGSSFDADRAKAGERRRTLVDWSSTFDADDDVARFFLGRMFEDGIKVATHREEAIGWYRAAADLGNVRAFWALAQQARQQGAIAEWELWCGKASDAGISQAQLALGEHLLSSAHGGRDRIEAIRWLSSAANAQESQASKVLARTYLEQGEECAYAAYLFAAQSGDLEAQCWVGLAHKDGTFGAPADSALAVHWLEASARGGFVAAQAHFAGLLMAGVGLSRDLAEAFKWYLLAAEGGDPLAQWNVSNFFVRGIGGVAKNLKQAYLWCSRAAQQGFPPAQASLGIFLLKMGKTDEAMEWLHRAAQNGDGEAQFNLFLQLERLPEKVGQYGASFPWCFAAAEAGIAAAQGSLAVSYATGEGLPLDLVEAHKWFVVAARSGHRASIENLKRSTVALNPQQIAEAERRAQAWCASSDRSRGN